MAKRNDDVKKRLDRIHEKNQEKKEQQATNRHKAVLWFGDTFRTARSEVYKALKAKGGHVTGGYTDNTGCLHRAIPYVYKNVEHKYVIQLTVSPKGFTVETSFDENPLTSTKKPLKDISKWTKEKVYDDFFKGYEKWGMREPTQAEIMASRNGLADMIKRQREIR